jgi:hypothetical protein
MQGPQRLDSAPGHSVEKGMERCRQLGERWEEARVAVATGSPVGLLGQPQWGWHTIPVLLFLASPYARGKQGPRREQSQGSGSGTGEGQSTGQG